MQKNPTNKEELAITAPSPPSLDDVSKFLQAAALLGALAYGLGWFSLQASRPTLTTGFYDVPRELSIFTGLSILLAAIPASLWCYYYYKRVRIKERIIPLLIFTLLLTLLYSSMGGRGFFQLSSLTAWAGQAMGSIITITALEIVSVGVAYLLTDFVTLNALRQISKRLPKDQADSLHKTFFENGQTIIKPLSIAISIGISILITLNWHIYFNPTILNTTYGSLSNNVVIVLKDHSDIIVGDFISENEKSITVLGIKVKNGKSPEDTAQDFIESAQKNELMARLPVRTAPLLVYTLPKDRLLSQINIAAAVLHSQK